MNEPEKKTRINPLIFESKFESKCGMDIPSDLLSRCSKKNFAVIYLTDLILHCIAVKDNFFRVAT